MLALSLWLACATLAEPAAPPDAPPPEAAAAPAPEATPVAAPVPPGEAAPASDTGTIVAGPDAAEAEPVPAAFQLTGFLPSDRIAVDAVLDLGTTFDSLDGGVDVHLRYRGFLAGVIVGGTRWSSNSEQLEWTRTLGLEAGYAWAPARLRLEGAVGYGRATDRREPASGSEQSTGDFLRVRAAADWVVAGGEGWRVAAGAGVFWRTVQGLSWSPPDHQEFGIGLRLCGEVGW
jgi:hypothetical protein